MVHDDHLRDAVDLPNRLRVDLADLTDFPPADLTDFLLGDFAIRSERSTALSSSLDSRIECTSGMPRADKREIADVTAVATRSLREDRERPIRGDMLQPGLNTDMGCINMDAGIDDRDNESVIGDELCSLDMISPLRERIWRTCVPRGVLTVTA